MTKRSGGPSGEPGGGAGGGSIGGARGEPKDGLIDGLIDGPIGGPTGGPAIAGWDTHIHLDKYDGRAEALVRESVAAGVVALVAVSMDLASCERTAALADAFPGVVRPAYGFHPEQPLPDDVALDRLFAWMDARRSSMAAVGEVGLPYFTRTAAEAEGRPFDEAPYVRLLERFVRWAAANDLPIALHAVYEDAHKALDLLEMHGVKKAHFHWFKGDDRAVSRLVAGGYYASATPDCLYEEETAALVRRLPLDRLLAETDGPWPFEGPYAGRETHPAMALDVVRRVAELKGVSVAAAAEALRRNAERLYGEQKERFEG